LRLRAIEECFAMPGTTATPQPEINRNSLPLYQASATHGGFFETCRLPRCRRARRCSGWHRDGASGPAVFHPTLPPCVTDDAAFRDLKQAFEDFCRCLREEFRPLDGADEAQDGDDAELCLFPDAVLPRPRRPGRHGGRRRRDQA